jgi:hypothetical protein
VNVREVSVTAMSATLSAREVMDFNESAASDVTLDLTELTWHAVTFSPFPLRRGNVHKKEAKALER